MKNHPRDTTKKHHIEPMNDDLFQPLSIDESQQVVGGEPGLSFEIEPKGGGDVDWSADISFW